MLSFTGDEQLREGGVAVEMFRARGWEICFAGGPMERVWVSCHLGCPMHPPTTPGE